MLTASIKLHESIMDEMYQSRPTVGHLSTEMC